jgi:hypothetical protein
LISIGFDIRNLHSLICAPQHQPKDFWKNELNDLSNKSGAEGSRSVESGPMLLDVLEGYLKYEVYFFRPQKDNH